MGSPRSAGRFVFQLDEERPKAKCDYVFTETGDHPQNKVFTCTLTLGKEGEAQFVGRKGAPIGIFTGEASNKKEAKRSENIEPVDFTFQKLLSQGLRSQC